MMVKKAKILVLKTKTIQKIRKVVQPKKHSKIGVFDLKYYELISQKSFIKETSMRRRFPFLTKRFVTLGHFFQYPLPCFFCAFNVENVYKNTEKC